MKPTEHILIHAVLGAALLVAAAGCASPGSNPSPTGGPAPAPPTSVQSGAGELQADYVFYPAYQVYYSSGQKHFVYLKGGSWITRSTPPKVSPEVLFASPSVSLGNQGAPSFLQ